MKSSFDVQDQSNVALWIQFDTYGHHDSAVELCDRADRGDENALTYAMKIWEVNSYDEIR